MARANICVSSTPRTRFLNFTNRIVVVLSFIVQGANVNKEYCTMLSFNGHLEAVKEKTSFHL